MTAAFIAVLVVVVIATLARWDIARQRRAVADLSSELDAIRRRR